MIKEIELKVRTSCVFVGVVVGVVGRFATQRHGQSLMAMFGHFSRSFATEDHAH